MTDHYWVWVLSRFLTYNIHWVLISNFSAYSLEIFELGISKGWRTNLLRHVARCTFSACPMHQCKFGEVWTSDLLLYSLVPWPLSHRCQSISQLTERMWPPCKDWLLQYTVHLVGTDHSGIYILHDSWTFIAQLLLTIWF